ncbi:MAG TPA: hypothetical protein VGS20_10800 [Candidatus Acidoferrales bacterium]|nr:hypothetical protein [Candidatus Acidoferrales bacterium]
MKFLVHSALFAGLAVAIAVLPAGASPAQGQQQPQKPQTGQQQPAQPPAQGQAAPGQPAAGQAAAPKGNPEEEKAYKEFYDLKPDNPQGIVASGEAFVQKFPDSKYLGSVYSKMTTAYQETGNDAKMFDVGQKALHLNPDNVDVLAILAYSIPRRINPDELGSDDKLNQAAGYAKHAMDLLDKMPKPANMTDDQFAAAKNSELASCHSGMGLVEYYQHNIPGMVTDLEAAVKLEAAPDPSDQFLLGFAYAQAGRWADAQGVLEKCSANPTPIQSRCKTVLDQVKKHASTPPSK